MASGVVILLLLFEQHILLLGDLQVGPLGNELGPQLGTFVLIVRPIKSSA